MPPKLTPGDECGRESEGAAGRRGGQSSVAGTVPTPFADRSTGGRTRARLPVWEALCWPGSGTKRPGVPPRPRQGTPLASRTLSQTSCVKLTTSLQLFEETARPQRAGCLSESTDPSSSGKGPSQPAFGAQSCPTAGDPGTRSARPLAPARGDNSAGVPPPGSHARKPGARPPPPVSPLRVLMHIPRDTRREKSCRCVLRSWRRCHFMSPF